MDIIVEVFDNMKKLDSQILIFIAVTVLICASIQPVIANEGIKINSQQIVPVDKDSAFIVASAKLRDLQKTSYSISCSNEIFDEQKNILCYVFNLDPQGYIVVSAYRALPPVLAYSFTSFFSQEGSLLSELVRSDLKLRLAHSSEISEEIIKDNAIKWDYYLNFKTLEFKDSGFCQWPEEGKTRSDGWLETKWSQNSPYNNFCPMDLVNSKRSIAGCPAVAIAQILNYHETIRNTNLNDTDDYYHSFAGNNFMIDDDYQTYDFPSFPQLNSYLDTLSFNYENQIPITNDEKAALVFACGVAAKQVYSSSISGTYGVNQAYQAYLRFAFDECQLLTDEADLYERVQDDIKNAIPVHLAVVNEEWTSGHNLVIDGYRDDGYYHLNFGWGGPYDGWYDLPEGIPFDLTVLEGVIVNISDGNLVSHLVCEGSLYWPDVIPASTVQGNFTIGNVGSPGSNIDWEITSWPEWGNWSFEPASGEGLSPESGPLKINVSVDIPDEKEERFDGDIIVADENDSNNSCFIPILLTTPRTRATFSFFELFFQRFFYVFPFFKFLLNC
jgi:hypothetical protein